MIGSINSLAEMSTITSLTNDYTSSSSDDFERMLKNAMNSSESDEIRQATDEMESYLLSMIYKQMKSSITTGDSLIPKGDYEEMFEDYLIDTQVSEMIKAGGVGLSDMLYTQLSLQTSQTVQFDASL